MVEYTSECNLQRLKSQLLSLRTLGSNNSQLILFVIWIFFINICNLDCPYKILYTKYLLDIFLWKYIFPFSTQVWMYNSS